ncbi:hypothetical protein ABIC75_003840 [Dyella japonica]|uniref:Tail fiber protein n=2 Tax=Dyella japonica TaxID=231455 RepID=A0ABV2JZ38_9GAMM
MAAVVAQLIVDSTGQNATDDGTTTTLLTNLKAAIHAQSIAVIGQARNLAVNQTAASSSLTMTADQIVVGTGLTGLTYVLPSFNKTVNLATTGAGGMDTGSAPVSGFVALYAIYNPTTGTSALLAVNATSAAAPAVYGGANMPSGYTASGLVSVWPTNGSGQFVIGAQIDRDFFTAGTNAVTTTTAIPQGTFAAVNIATIVPKNARKINTAMQCQGGASAQNTLVNLYITSTGSILGAQAAGNSGSIGQLNVQVNGIALLTPQTFWWNCNVSSGTFTSAGIIINGYSI